MPPLRITANFILFQAAWFAGILAPPIWASALVALILVIHLRMIAHAGEWRLLAMTMLIGGIWDTTLSITGFYNFNPSATFWNPAVIPLWLLLLWGNFATTLCHSLYWLSANKIIAALLGSILGPAAYIGGAAITNKLIITADIAKFFIISAPFWAILCALLPQQAKRIMTTANR